MMFTKVIKLAENGFHIRLDSLSDMSNLKIGLDGLVLRPFRIRRATFDDHEELCYLEKACWSKELQNSTENIFNRLKKQIDFESQIHLIDYSILHCRINNAWCLIYLDYHLCWFQD